MLHGLSKDACGLPQPLGLGDPDAMSAGIVGRGKNHIDIADDVNSVA